jgi:N-acetylglucosamine-6-phosphate deacetylase
MSKNQLYITNGKVITPEGIIENASVVITDNKIIDVGQNVKAGSGAVIIDANGEYISPGFIDIHIHGGGGYDFMDGDVESFLQIAAIHARYGTTMMMPTTLSGSKEELINTLEAYELAHLKNDYGSRFAGMHLEGPYFAMNQRGAQDPRYIRNPDPAEYIPLVEKYPFIKRWSAAPELPGAIEFAHYMKSKGILPALAHTDALYDEVVKGFEAGYTLATHLYSGMSGVTRKNAFRYAGTIESAFIIDDMDVEVIADGVHLPAPFLKLIYKIKGPDRIALVTDAMRAAALPPGESILGSKANGLKVIVEDGVAKLPDRSSFAGSVATADRLVRTMVNEGGVDLIQAIKMITVTPARILGLEHETGSIVPGKLADLTIFDSNISVSTTIVKGRVVFRQTSQVSETCEV